MMRTNVHLSFPGTCDEAFTFYEKVFGTRRVFTMTWGEVPKEFNMPEGMDEKIIHMAMPLGSMTLMGSDSPPAMQGKFAAFDIAIEDEEPEIRRLFDLLSEGGSVAMPLGPMFWGAPLFGMCQDRFGVDWMLSVPRPGQE